MIQILTADGISLDLVKGCSFEIEYNNPMFDDSRMPVPFSTAIDLLPTAANCKALSWLPALRLAPEVKELEVSLILNGIEFLKGILIFDSLEDGHASYTFSGRDINRDWGKKLYDKVMLDKSAFTQTKDFNAFENGDEDFVWPLLVNKQFTGHDVADHDDISYVMSQDVEQRVSLEKKFWNAATVIPESECGHLMPAMMFSYLFGQMKLSAEGLKNYLDHFCILAPFKLEESYKNFESILVREHLPDMSYADFFRNVAKMFAGAIFQDKDKPGYYKLVLFNEMTKYGNYDDWTGRLAKEFNSTVETGRNYSLAYNNSSEEGPDKNSETLMVYSIKASLFPCPVPANLTNKPYTHVYTARTSPSIRISTKTIYRIVHAPDSSGNEKNAFAATASADCIYNRNYKYIKNQLNSDDTEDVSVEFDLIKCAPYILNDYETKSISRGNKTLSRLTQRCSLGGLIEATENTDERPTTPIIGVYRNGQISPDGITLEPEIPFPAPDAFGVGLFQDNLPDNRAISLMPVDLFRNFHSQRANWLAKDKQVISCDVDLDEYDLAVLDFTRKARICGRDFFIRKITVTINQESSRVSCSAEFISC